MENTTADAWRLAGRAESTGAAATALSQGQVDSAVDRTALAPSHPQVPTVPRSPVPREGQSEAGVHEFHSSVPNDATVWSPQWSTVPVTGGWAIYAPHLGIGLLERVALNLAEGCCPSTLSGCTQKPGSIILT